MNVPEVSLQSAMNHVLDINADLFTSRFFQLSCIGNNTSGKRGCRMGERLAVNIWEPLPARELKEYEDTILSDPLELVVVQVQS